MYNELEQTIERVWADRDLLQQENNRAAIRRVVELVDRGDRKSTRLNSSHP